MSRVLLLYYLSLMFSASLIGDVLLIFVLILLFVTSGKSAFTRRGLLLLFVGTIVLFGQLLFNTNGSIYVNVSESVYREVLTVGTYPISGNVNYSRWLKFMVYLAVAVKLSTFSKRQINYTSRLAAYVLLLLLFLQILFTMLFGQQANFIVFNNFIEGQALTVSNILPYRFHLGFYEPSSASMFFGVLIYLGFSNKSLIWQYTLLVLMVLITESITSILVFSILYFSTRIIVFVAAIIAVGLNFVQFNPRDLFFLRSFYDRYPDITFDNWQWIFFGVDFGNIYSFYPVIGIVCQIGIFGLIFLVLSFRSNKILNVLLALSVMPQLYFFPISLVGLLWKNATKESI